MQNKIYKLTDMFADLIFNEAQIAELLWRMCTTMYGCRGLCQARVMNRNYWSKCVV